jgi:hypothetical protein
MRWPLRKTCGPCLDRLRAYGLGVPVYRKLAMANDKLRLGKPLEKENAIRHAF